LWGFRAQTVPRRGSRAGPLPFSPFPFSGRPSRNACGGSIWPFFFFFSLPAKGRAEWYDPFLPPVVGKRVFRWPFFWPPKNFRLSGCDNQALFFPSPCNGRNSGASWGSGITRPFCLADQFFVFRHHTPYLSPLAILPPLFPKLTGSRYHHGPLCKTTAAPFPFSFPLQSDARQNIISLLSPPAPRKRNIPVSSTVRLFFFFFFGPPPFSRF